MQAAIDALIDQTKSIERAVDALKLDAIAFEGSDSLDRPTRCSSRPNLHRSQRARAKVAPGQP